MINEWNFFIVFQYTKISAPYFDEVIKKDILNARATNLYFYILKHIVDEAKAEVIEYYYDPTNNAPTSNWKSTFLTADLSVFFSNPSVAQEIWSNFFNISNKKNDRLNFIAINGHGGGISFYPSNISNIVLTNEQKEAFFISNLVQNVEVKYYHQKLTSLKYTNLEYKSLTQIDSKTFKVIPVSFFNEAIESSFTKKVDFVFLENCFMQCAETGFIFKDNAKFLGGSEGEYFLGNMPYDAIFSTIASIGLTFEDADHKKLAATIANNLDKRFERNEIKDIFSRTGAKSEELRYYTSYSINDLSKYIDFKKLVSDFGGELLEAVKNNNKLYNKIHKLRSDRKICRDVIEGDYVGIIDLSNFLKELNKLQTKELDKVRPVIHSLIDFIKSQLVFEKHFPDQLFNRENPKGICPNGVSFFFPRNFKEFPYSEKTKAVFNEIYSSGNPAFLFVKDNKWGDFVMDYFNKTNFPPLPPHIIIYKHLLKIFNRVTDFFRN